MRGANDIPLLLLSDQTPVAEGTQRWIYRHPQNDSLLVKVLKPRADTAGRAALATFTERNFPAIRTRWARKEYMEYLRLMLRQAAPIHLPITHMYGFVQTDIGLGCLTEAVTEGPDLGAGLANTITGDDLALLNDTLARLYRYDIRAGDMTARNFVFGQRTTHGETGPRECVLVDGFGDIHAIPVRSLGRWTNAKGLDDSCARLARKTALRWDARQRQFYRD